MACRDPGRCTWRGARPRRWPTKGRPPGRPRRIAHDPIVDVVLAARLYARNGSRAGAVGAAGADRHRQCSHLARRLHRGHRSPLVSTIPPPCSSRPTAGSSLCHKAGALRVVKNGALLPTPFVSSLTVDPVASAACWGWVRSQLRVEPVRLRLLHGARRRWRHGTQPRQPLHGQRRRRARRQRAPAHRRPRQPEQRLEWTTAAPSTSAPTASSTSRSATTPIRRSPAVDVDPSRQDAALQRRRLDSHRQPVLQHRVGRPTARSGRSGLRNPFTFALNLPGVGPDPR